jgi:hypothetical protein
VFRPNVPIDRVLFLGDGGNDRVTYNMTGELTTTRSIVTVLGAGIDAFHMTVRETISAPLAVSVGGGPGNDQLVMTLIGSVGAEGRLNFTANGAGGLDLVQFQTTSFVATDPGSEVVVNLLGGLDNDRVRFNYSGQLDGELTFRAYGDGGADRIRANVILNQASTGILNPSAVSGGAQNDVLVFLVVNRSTEAITFNQFVAGDGGKDIAFRTPDVFQINCEIDRLV